MNEIGIRIFWGPWEGDFNPAPIVSVGNIVGDIVPVVPTLVREEQSWMIKSDENKALYASFSKECCINTDNYIQLLVCVIIPKDQRLADQKSPLDLLEAVKRQFEQLFSYDFEATMPNKERVNEDFGQLLEDYTLTECPWYVFNMEGTNPASFCVDSRAQLDALMRFNAYKELAHVEHLELGFKCRTTVIINTKGKSDGVTEVKRGKGLGEKGTKPESIIEGKSIDIDSWHEDIKPKEEQIDETKSSHIFDKASDKLDEAEVKGDTKEIKSSKEAFVPVEQTTVSEGGDSENKDEKKTGRNSSKNNNKYLLVLLTITWVIVFVLGFFNIRQSNENSALVSSMDNRSCQTYLKEHPNGRSVESVENQMRDNDWMEYMAYKRVNDIIEQYRASDISRCIDTCIEYLGSYPDGKHLTTIDSLKVELEKELSLVELRRQALTLLDNPTKYSRENYKNWLSSNNTKNKALSNEEALAAEWILWCFESKQTVFIMKQKTMLEEKYGYPQRGFKDWKQVYEAGETIRVDYLKTKNKQAT